MSTSGFYEFDHNFCTLLGESESICKEVARSLDDPESADINELLALEYRLTKIADRMTVYLSPAPAAL